MATRLELAEQKLERLKNELELATQNAFGHARIANGQPMNDKRNGHSYMAKQTRLEDKCINLTREIEKQEQRVEDLRHTAERRANGWARHGRGLEISKQNLPRLKAEVEAYERGEARFCKSTIKRYKQAIEELEKERTVTEHAQRVIDSGQVTQWAKKPHIYFVKGMRKIAVELQEDGTFELSHRYYPYDENDKKKVLEMIGKGVVNG